MLGIIGEHKPKSCRTCKFVDHKFRAISLDGSEIWMGACTLCNYKDISAALSINTTLDDCPLVELEENKYILKN